MKQNGTIVNAPQPKFGLSAPTFNFDSLIDGTRSTPFIYELDLTTARSFTAGTAVQIKITGNCLLIDSAPDVGNGYVIFEGVQDNTAGQVRAPIYAQPGFVTRLPFANVFVANAAQPGKKLRFIYGVDLDFQMMFPAQMAASPAPYSYTAAYQSVTALAANGSEQVWSAAQNTNGVILHRASIASNGVGLTKCCYIAATIVPAAITGGEIIVAPNILSGTNQCAQLEVPVLIRPGRGLWRFADSAEGSTVANALYSIL